MRKRIAYNHLKQARRLMDKVEELEAKSERYYDAGLEKEYHDTVREIAEKREKASERVRVVTLASNDHPELYELISEMVDY